jgi:hypothetical protein
MIRALGFVLLAHVAAVANAQALTIVTPPDVFVSPGESVQLSFELVAADSIEVEVSAVSLAGWAISLDPPSLSLAPEVAGTVVVTVDVPADAPAFVSDQVTLRVDGVDPAAERTVELRVIEVVDLTLEAPTQAPLGPDGLRVVVTNAGNSPQDIILLLLRDDGAVVTVEARPEAGASTQFAFDLDEEGAHTVQLRSARGLEAERSVRAIRFGAPEPAPFVLAGLLTGGYDLDDGWSAELSVRGRLSDFSSLDLRASAPAWRRSYVALTVDQASLRLGAAGPAHFGLDLPREFGLSASYQHDSGLGVGAVVGMTSTDRLVVLAAGSWSGDGHGVAIGGGLRADDPVAALTARYSGDDLTLGLTSRYRQSALSARVTADVRDQEATTTLRAEARDVFTVRSRLDLEARYRTRLTGVYGNVTVPLAESASWTWRTGMTQELPADVPGSFQLALQAGDRESFARVAYRVALPQGWRTSNTVGVRWDTTGFGVSLDSAWNWSDVNSFGLDTELVYYPALERMDGRTRVRVVVVEDPAMLSLDGTWNHTNATLGLGGTLGIAQGPWFVDFEASARYAWTRPTAPWALEASVFLSYAFDVPVAPSTVEALGGRRLGTVVVRVLADGEPLSGVVVSVGRFRDITDDQGRFELQLAPGTHRVSVERATIPSGYRVDDSAPPDVEVTLRGTHEIELNLVRNP